MMDRVYFLKKKNLKYLLEKFLTRTTVLKDLDGKMFEKDFL
jgi:hypothetical protein